MAIRTTVSSNRPIADQITALQGGVETLESIKTDIEQGLDLAVTAASTTMTGSALTLIEFIPTAPSVFEGGAVDLTNMASGDTIVVLTYRKIKSGGNYILETTTTYADAQAVPLKTMVGCPVRYGYKVTIQQTGGTNRVVDNIWFTAAPGV